MRISLIHSASTIDNVKVIRIIAPVDFTFIWYRKFRDVYKNENSIATKFIIDFTNTESLSASALGMILLIKDHADSIKGQLSLVNPNFKQPFDLLHLTNFDHMLNITFDEHSNTNKTTAMRKHGSYIITSNRQILTMKAYDDWNIETVISCCKTFKEEAKKLMHRSWSCIVDLSEWELGPPEMLAEIKNLNIWSENNNQTFEAVIVKNSLQRHLLEDSHAVFKNIQSQFFDNHDDAFYWLTTTQRALK